MSQKIFSCEYVAIEHITQTASNNIFFMVAHFFFYMSVKTALHLKFGKRLLPTSFKVSMSFKVLCLFLFYLCFVFAPHGGVSQSTRCKYIVFCDTIHFTSFIFAYFSRFLFNRSRFGVFPGQKAFPVRLIPVPFPFSVCPLSENDKKRKEQVSGAKPFFRIGNRFFRHKN